jgi:hypothetical protein
MCRSIEGRGVVWVLLRVNLAGKEAFERALRIFEKFLPADHPNIATARKNLRIVVEE